MGKVIVRSNTESVTSRKRVGRKSKEALSYVRGAAQGFDPFPRPMVIPSVEDALSEDLRMVLGDVTRAVKGLPGPGGHVASLK
jgi:hypothetical protein